MKYVKGFRPSGSMVVAIVALIVACAGTAVAAATINGRDLVNNTVGSNKIKNRSLKVKDFSGNTKSKLKGARGPKGAKGQRGKEGPQGPQGPAGDPATYNGPNWGLIDRNTIAAGMAELRAGPVFGTGAAQKPPLGVGSVGLQTPSGNDKVAFGNQVDFAGDPVSGLDRISYSYFVTGEDLASDPGNLPNISIEIDPSVADRNYTSMNYNPPDAPPIAQGWIDDDAAANDGDESGWWFSNGLVAAATGCSQASFCSLEEAKQALVANNDGGPAASISSIAVTKGRDFEFEGAVDALQINDTIYDFEPFGVNEVAAP